MLDDLGDSSHLLACPHVGDSLPFSQFYLLNCSLESGRAGAGLLTGAYLPVNVIVEVGASTLHSSAQVCQKIGVSPRTLRYYEELGLLPGVRRRNGGRRAYGPEEIERLRFIQRLKQMGLSLQEIGDLNAIYAIRGSTQAMLEKLR